MGISGSAPQGAALWDATESWNHLGRKRPPRSCPTIKPSPNKVPKCHSYKCATFREICITTGRSRRDRHVLSFSHKIIFPFPIIIVFFKPCCLVLWASPSRINLWSSWAGKCTQTSQILKTFPSNSKEKSLQHLCSTAAVPTPLRHHTIIPWSKCWTFICPGTVMTQHMKANLYSSFGISQDQSSWSWECWPAPCTASEWELSKIANREKKCHQIMNTLF